MDISDALELRKVAVGRNLASRALLLWEVYVDRGNISKYMVDHYPDVDVANFSLPEWDFKNKQVRKKFVELMEKEKPHFI